MSYYLAAWYIEQIEHRLGVADSGSVALSSLQMACSELNAHPWCWLSERTINVVAEEGATDIELPENVERVTAVYMKGCIADEVEPHLLVGDSAWVATRGVYALVGRDNVEGGFRWVLRLATPATAGESFDLSAAFQVPEPVSSQARVMVPTFLRLALVELAAAIAEGMTFPEEGSVAKRTQDVWEGQTMKLAKTRDGLSSDGPQPQTGASAIDRSSQYDGVHSGMPRGTFG